MPFNKAIILLKRASSLYDSKAYPYSNNHIHFFSPFSDGAKWMKNNIELIRHRNISTQIKKSNFELLGFIKYGLCSLFAVLFLLLFFFSFNPIWIVLSILSFYTLEAQMVFLFPLSIDGSTKPFKESFLLTQHSGGTIKVMLTVLPIASTMIFGGLLKRRTVRSWHLGCLAVLLWYEDIRLLKK